MFHAAAAEVPATSNHGTILVADDDPVAIEHISTVLENAGWTVKSARNGRQALETIFTSRLDGLILDMRMPEVDGYEVCLSLLRRGKRIPTLVITGCIGDSEPLGYLNVARTLCKPLNPGDLLEFADTIKRPIVVVSACPNPVNETDTQMPRR